MLVYGIFLTSVISPSDLVYSLIAETLGPVVDCLNRIRSAYYLKSKQKLLERVILSRLDGYNDVISRYGRDNAQVRFVNIQSGERLYF